MSNSKDKRIKRLKKKHIWPSVLGLFLILMLFALLIMLALGTTCLDVVQRKVNECSNRSAKIAGLYEEYNETSAESITTSVLTYMDMETDIETVAVTDTEGGEVWSSDGSYPNEDKMTEFELRQAKFGPGIQMLIEEDEEGVFSEDENTLVINTDIISKLDFVSLLNETEVFVDGGQASLLQLKVWYAVPVNHLNVFVLNQINVYANDLVMLLVTLVLFIIMISIFALYYIVSFVSVIVSIRKTTKIIYTDMVTGGDNWLGFVKKGTSLLKRNRGSRRKYAMIHLRMYKYRSFCTCFGVQEGEALIEKFYYALKKSLKYHEVMAYHENAEFGLLICYNDEQQLRDRIEALKSTLNAVLPNMKMYFGVGVCQIEAGQRDVEQLYNNALIACDMMGEDTENRIAFFDEEMNKQKLWERKVEDEMDRALLNKEFKVYLQPKISAMQEILAGAEALVRWIHPKDGFIPPNKFIPIFEKNGFILKLDDYMLEEVASLQARWISEGRKIVPISVNVSRAHFTREDLAEHICSIVDKYRVPHSVIELELTESAFFDDKKVLLDTVKKLREFGFIVSMDDFGAGYSSLNSLKELQLDVLKIDADFFRGENVEERGMLIVSEVIDLAKKLNMKIVAEGIESREQVDFLVEQECDLIQGYFFAKPMAVEEFVEKYKY